MAEKGKEKGKGTGKDKETGKGASDGRGTAEGPDPVLLSQAHEMLEDGKRLLDKEDLKAAASAFEGTVSLLERARAGPEDRVRALVGLSTVNLKIGALEKGEANALDAVKLITGPGVKVAMKGEATHVYGVALMKRGDLVRSQSQLERALSLFETARDRDGVATACRNIGNNYMLRSLYSKAVVYYNRSIKMFEEAGKEREAWFARQNIALAMGLQGYYEEAVKELGVVLENVTRLEVRSTMATCLANLGYFLCQSRRYKEALERFEESSRICAQTGEYWVDAYNVVGKAEALVGIGEVGAAERLLEERFKSLIASKSDDIIGRTRKVRGIIYKELGEMRKAEDEFALASNVLAGGMHHVFQATVLIEWARARLKAGDRDGAVVLLRKARDIYTALKLPALEKRLDELMKREHLT